MIAAVREGNAEVLPPELLMKASRELLLNDKTHSPAGCFMVVTWGFLELKASGTARLGLFDLIDGAYVENNCLHLWWSAGPDCNLTPDMERTVGSGLHVVAAGTFSSICVC